MLMLSDGLWNAKMFKMKSNPYDKNELIHRKMPNATMKL